MQKDVLKTANRLLSKKPASGGLFKAAVHALLAHADDLKAWTEHVETA